MKQVTVMYSQSNTGNIPFQNKPLSTEELRELKLLYKQLHKMKLDKITEFQQLYKKWR